MSDNGRKMKLNLYADGGDMWHPSNHIVWPIDTCSSLLRSPKERRNKRSVYIELGFETVCKRIPKYLNGWTILFAYLSENYCLYMF